MTPAMKAYRWIVGFLFGVAIIGFWVGLMYLVYRLLFERTLAFTLSTIVECASLPPRRRRFGNLSRITPSIPTLGRLTGPSLTATMCAFLRVLASELRYALTGCYHTDSDRLGRSTLS